MKRAAISLFVLAVLAWAAAPATDVPGLVASGFILLAGAVVAGVLHAFNS